MITRLKFKKIMALVLALTMMLSTAVFADVRVIGPGERAEDDQEYQFIDNGVLKELYVQGTSYTTDSSITKIQKATIFNMAFVTDLTITANVKEINDGFQGKSRLERVTIQGATTIGSNVFSGNSRLNSVTLPSTLKSIGNTAFSGNRQLTSISLPSGLETIGQQAFRRTGLTEITIPGSVKKVSASAFEYSAVKKVVLEDGVTTIDTNAFGNTIHLTDAYIPASVTSIAVGAFPEGIKVHTTKGSYAETYATQNGMTVVMGSGTSTSTPETTIPVTQPTNTGANTNPIDLGPTVKVSMSATATGQDNGTQAFTSPTPGAGFLPHGTVVTMETASQYITQVSKYSIKSAIKFADGDRGVSKTFNIASTKSEVIDFNQNYGTADQTMIQDGTYVVEYWDKDTYMNMYTHNHDNLDYDVTYFVKKDGKLYGAGGGTEGDFIKTDVVISEPTTVGKMKTISTPESFKLTTMKAWGIEQGEIYTHDSPELYIVVTTNYKANGDIIDGAIRRSEINIPNPLMDRTIRLIKFADSGLPEPESPVVKIGGLDQYKGFISATLGSGFLPEGEVINMENASQYITQRSKYSIISSKDFADGDRGASKTYNVESTKTETIDFAQNYGTAEQSDIQDGTYTIEYWDKDTFLDMYSTNHDTDDFDVSTFVKKDGLLYGAGGHIQGDFVTAKTQTEPNAVGTMRRIQTPDAFKLTTAQAWNIAQGEVYTHDSPELYIVITTVHLANGEKLQTYYHQNGYDVTQIKTDRSIRIIKFADSVGNDQVTTTP